MRLRVWWVAPPLNLVRLWEAWSYVTASDRLLTVKSIQFIHHWRCAVMRVVQSALLRSTNLSPRQHPLPCRHCVCFGSEARQIPNRVLFLPSTWAPTNSSPLPSGPTSLRARPVLSALSSTVYWKDKWKTNDRFCFSGLKLLVKTKTPFISARVLEVNKLYLFLNSSSTSREK